MPKKQFDTVVAIHIGVVVIMICAVLIAGSALWQMDHSREQTRVYQRIEKLLREDRR